MPLRYSLIDKNNKALLSSSLIQFFYHIFIFVFPTLSFRDFSLSNLYSTVVLCSISIIVIAVEMIVTLNAKSIEHLPVGTRD